MVSGDPFSKPVHSPDLQDIGGIAGLPAKIKPASVPGFPSLIEKKRHLFRHNTKAPKPRSKSVVGSPTEAPLNIPPPEAGAILTPDHKKAGVATGLGS